MPDTSDSHDAGSVDRRLSRLLDSPHLDRIVPHLEAETLHRLIRYRGLDACADLVAAATASQLSALADLDLWRSARPGLDEQFDGERFGEWVETLIEHGETFAVRFVASLDRDLVAAGFSRHIRVVDCASLEPTESSDDEAPERHFAPDATTCEIGGYVVYARTPDAWDGIVRLLAALDTADPECFRAIMAGCRAVSSSGRERDGLDDLLSEPEQLLHDIAIDREARRTSHGYVTAADARAFLELARRPRVSGPEPNPIAAAYLRNPGDAREETDVIPGAPMDGERQAAAEIVDLLAESGLVPERPRALLAPANEDGAPRMERLRTLMQELARTEPGAHAARCSELAFLANVLMAGCSVAERAFTAPEASDAAASICNLGLERRPDLRSPADSSLVAAFEAGWAALYDEVSLATVQALLAALSNIAADDTETGASIRDLRLELVRQREAGTPWRARDALEVIAILDTTVWVALLGLLDECPVVRAALGALLDGQTTAVSATAFEFIGTRSQVDRVRGFLERLPDLLSR